MGKRWETGFSCLSKSVFPEVFGTCSESPVPKETFVPHRDSIWKRVWQHFTAALPVSPQLAPDVVWLGVEHHYAHSRWR